jgi:MFS family permease
MDVSSELVHSLLPLFMVTTLGASMLAVGVIEGIAEATSLVVKVFSGVLSDYVGRRKWLAVLGYGLAAATKPVFALAGSLPWVVAARFVDRVGKGIRGAPRDALVADLTPPEVRGAAYGLRQALDTVGAFAGPLLAIALMSLFAGDFRKVFWFAVIPAVLSVAVLILGVRDEQKPKVSDGEKRRPLSASELRRLPGAFWIIALIGAVMTLARFSEAFLVLRAQSVGMAIAWVPLVMVAMNVVYALSAYPAGKLADAGHERGLLMGGFVMLVVSDVVLARATGSAAVMAGTALWGLHMGLTQGLLAAMISAAAPADLRATAFGFFNLLSGLALLLASALAGWLWDRFGPAETFFAGAVLAAIALLSLLALRPSRKPGPATVSPSPPRRP